MRSDASLLAFSAGAFAALGLLWVSSTAALGAVGVGALVALILVRDKRKG